MANFFDCDFYKDVQKTGLIDIKSRFDRWFEDAKRSKNFDGKDERLMLLKDVIRHLDEDWQKELGTHPDGRDIELISPGISHETSKKRKIYILGEPYEQGCFLKFKDSVLTQKIVEEKRGAKLFFIYKAKQIKIVGFSLNEPGMILVSFDGSIMALTESDLSQLEKI